MQYLNWKFVKKYKNFIAIFAVVLLCIACILYWEFRYVASSTQKNLLDSFSGESQAINKYTYFAQKAREEGLDFVAKEFESIAKDEKRHALAMYDLISTTKSTKDFLQISIEGESYEEQTKYPKMAEIARSEGNEKAAKLFEMIYKEEREHKGRFEKLLKKINNKEN